MARLTGNKTSDGTQATAAGIRVEAACLMCHGDNIAPLGAASQSSTVGEAVAKLAVDGLMPEAGPPTALRSLALVDELVRADRIDLARTYTNTFAQRAKLKFRA